LNYPFLSNEQNSLFSEGRSVILENPMQGEFPELRKSLLPGLLQAAARNLSRGNLNLAMLEEGSVFLPTSGHAVTTLPIGNQRPSAELLGQLNASIPAQPRLISGVLVGDWISAGVGQHSVQVGFAQAIDAAGLTAQAAGLAIEIEQAEIQGFHPGRGAHVKIAGTVVGSVGELHPDIAARLYLPRRVDLFEINLDEVFALAPEVLQAAELRVMPAATQDLSLVVDVEIPAAAVLKGLQTGAGELLESIHLVDDYRGQGLTEGKKSLTFALVFRSSDKTLTQAEATQARDAAVALVNAEFGAELRA
jgi:phenylalanyl-tRNA synthetase beta chain